MDSYKTHPYYTHQPFFIEIIKATKGNILECGCGDGSTMMIKEQIQDSNRKLVSLESNLEWLNKYTYLADSFHDLYHVDATNDDTLETGNKWVEFIEQKKLNNFEIVFLDSSPWLSRKCCFDYFLDKAKIIIIHDFDYFPGNNIIGKVANKETRIYNGQRLEKIDCNLDGIVKNYRLFYPPYKYFAGATGPPTLVCSNIMSDDEFNALINTIEANIDSYYN
jgi:hypothetical protein